MTQQLCRPGSSPGSQPGDECMNNISTRVLSSDGNQRPYRNGYLPSATIQTSSVNLKENFFWWLMSTDCCLRPDWRQPCPADAGFGDIKLGHTRPFYGDASARDYVLTPKQSPLSLSPDNNPAIRVFWHPDNNVVSFITPGSAQVLLRTF